MRVVLFGAGSPLSLACFRVLRDDELVAVVVPRPRLRLSPRGLWRALRHRRGARALVDAAHKRGIAVLPFDPRHPTLALTADLCCIAAFPWILPQEVLATPRLGTVNVHFSLLPRHRGKSPLQAAYEAGDRTTGVTLHWVTEEVDAGEIIAQWEMPLDRDRPMEEVYLALCDRAATLLRDFLDGPEHATRPASPRTATEGER